MSKLQVAEMFYSLQGEGPHAGTPAVFLRLAGCNLQCGKTDSNILDVDPQEDEPDGDATWVCDTIDVWREPDNSYTPEELFDEFVSRGWMEMLNEGHANLVLTGGEPTLPQHQKAFSEFVEYDYEQTRDVPFVEVETNGTQELTDQFISTVNLFNCSLKLSNSGHTRDERIVDEAQEQYVNMGRKPYGPEVKWKFVVSDADDIEEIDDIINSLDVPDDLVSLMPAGQTQEQLRETYPEVAEIVKDRKWDFSPRLHVDMWNQQTGV